MDIIGQNGNEGLHYDVESEPAEEFDDDSKTISDTEVKISSLENQRKKIQRNDSTGKRTAIALNEIDSKIQKLRNEDNTITY